VRTNANGLSDRSCAQDVKLEQLRCYLTCSELRAVLSLYPAFFEMAIYNFFVTTELSKMPRSSQIEASTQSQTIDARSYLLGIARVSGPNSGRFMLSALGSVDRLAGLDPFSDRFQHQEQATSIIAAIIPLPHHTPTVRTAMTLRGRKIPVRQIGKWRLQLGCRCPRGVERVQDQDLIRDARGGKRRWTL
jgi:hypothetical protein